MAHWDRRELNRLIAEHPDEYKKKFPEPFSAMIPEDANSENKLATEKYVSEHGGSPDAVKYTEQSLTAEQKAQALSNIGAASDGDVAALADQKYEGPYATDGDLPAASASTMGAIYLVGPDANDEYERKVTKLSGSTYSWGSLGKTSIVLANYATNAEVSQLEAEVDENANFREGGGTDTLAMTSGLIGANDGVLYPGGGGGKYLYSDLHSAEEGKIFNMSNPNNKTISWHRAHFYNGSTYVRYVELGSTVGNYTAPSGNDYDNIRFCFCSNDALATSDIIITTDVDDVLVPIKDVIESNTARIEALEEDVEEINTSIDIVNKGYRVATGDDITQSKTGAFKIESGKLYGTRSGEDPQTAVIFKQGIKAIEFDISSLWDSNLVSLAFGVGVDTGNSNKECYALCYLPTSSRPNDIGYVQNQDFDGSASNAQATSIYGQGHFSGDYRQPQLVPAPISIGDHCRIELIGGHFFKGSKYNSLKGTWDWWFCLDADGAWNNPSRFGWSTRKAIGFCVRFGTFTDKELLSNIRIVDEADKSSGIYSELGKCFPDKKNWLAIGDSITEINENNGLSYVGFAQRRNGFNVTNQGHSGWTIYKLWRDRSEAGWETDVQAMEDGDIITILAGTNDFDTATTYIPADDAAMDANGNPHPRFGTTDPTSEDAKDPHTTLGCLRLMIERILTLKPGARLSVFSPFYREKGRPVGQTSWDKLYINSDGHTIYDYADAIYSVAREYNLPAYNTCRDCGINAMTLATYTYDDLHIGQVGGELIGDYVAKRIS